MSDDNTITRIQPANKRGGVWVQMGEEEYRIPPLGFGSLKDLQERITTLQGMVGIPNADQLQAVAEIVHQAIIRNYPDMPLAQVVDMLDMANFQPVLNAVLNTAGYRKAAEGESQPTTSL